MIHLVQGFSISTFDCRKVSSTIYCLGTLPSWFTENHYQVKLYPEYRGFKKRSIAKSPRVSIHFNHGWLGWNLGSPMTSQISMGYTDIWDIWVLYPYSWDFPYIWQLIHNWWFPKFHGTYGFLDRFGRLHHHSACHCRHQPWATGLVLGASQSVGGEYVTC